MTPRRPFEAMSVSEMEDSIYRIPEPFDFENDVEYYDDMDEYDDEFDDDEYDEDEDNEDISNTLQLLNGKDDIDDEAIDYTSNLYKNIYDDENIDHSYIYMDGLAYDPDRIFLSPYRTYGVRYGKIDGGNEELLSKLNREEADSCVRLFLIRLIFFQIIRAMMLNIKIYTDSLDRLAIGVDTPNYNNISNIYDIIDIINDSLDRYSDILDYRDRFTYESFYIKEELINPDVNRTVTNAEDLAISSDILKFLLYGFKYLFCANNSEEKYDKSASTYVFNCRVVKSEYEKPEVSKSVYDTFEKYIDVSYIKAAMNEYIAFGKKTNIFSSDYTYDNL